MCWFFISYTSDAKFPAFVIVSLTKRFTLLRTSNGDPVTLYDLKDRFAQQRINGDHSISEAEEDMLLQALSRIRSGNAGASMKGGRSGSDKSETPSSPFSESTDLAHSSGSHSTATTTTSSGVHESAMQGSSSLSPSPSNRSSKRHSNNLFGAGFRERSYMRKQTARMTGSNRSVLSTTPSVATTGSTNELIDSYGDSITSPRDSGAIMNVNDEVTAVSDGIASGTDTVEFPKPLSDVQVKRLSMSLEKIIQEMEEEAEDQVLVPRTPITPNGVAVHQRTSGVTSDVVCPFVH